MSFYLFLMDRNGAASESRWVIMGIAVKIGQSVSVINVASIGRMS
jgi:hypothetical protein